MRQLIAGNWKMNGLAGAAAAFVEALLPHAGRLACDVLVCPPSTLLAGMAARLEGSGVQVGGQDCHALAAGAHTGDVSAAMLRDAGATWVIVGHSERRADHAEANALVRAKAAAAAAAGLRPIVCVGETAAQRHAGRQAAVVGVQLALSLPDDFAGAVAYEPIWAIGSGRTATVADVAGMHGFIRDQLRRRFGATGEAMRILYGGSVKPANAAGLLAVPEVGGALVGGASLRADEFVAIARAARRAAARAAGTG